MDRLRSVALSTPTTMVFQVLAEDKEIPPAASAAISAALGRGKIRPGSQHMIFDTELTYDEISSLLAALKVYHDFSQHYSRDDSAEMRELVMASVAADMEHLHQVGGPLLLELLGEPPKRKSWFRR